MNKIYCVLRTTGPGSPDVRTYRTAIDLPQGNAFYVVSSEAELLASAIPGAGLVDLYNYCAEKFSLDRVVRFSDRATGARRLWQVIIDNMESLMSGKPKNVAPSSKKDPGKARGNFAGRRCFAKRDIWPENPRRKGTHGHKSLEILIMSEDNGILYEDFLAAGGRRMDLAWDIKMGRAYIR